jgi:hypothetical protein
MARHFLPNVVIFAVCCGILVGSLILTPPQNGNPNVQIGSIPLPGFCTFRSVTGIPCPGCGLLRSMVSAMHGDFAGSLAYHRLGLLTLLYVALQFFFRLGVLLFPVFSIRLSRIDVYLNRGIILLAMLFGINWILTVILVI